MERASTTECRVCGFPRYQREDHAEWCDRVSLVLIQDQYMISERGQHLGQELLKAVERIPTTRAGRQELRHAFYQFLARVDDELERVESL